MTTDSNVLSALALSVSYLWEVSAELALWHSNFSISMALISITRYLATGFICGGFLRHLGTDIFREFTSSCPPVKLLDVFYRHIEASIDVDRLEDPFFSPSPSCRARHAHVLKKLVEGNEPGHTFDFIHRTTLVRGFVPWACLGNLPRLTPYENAPVIFENCSNLRLEIWTSPMGNQGG